MPRVGVQACAIALLAALAAGPTWAAEDPPPTDLAEEVRALNKTLGELVALLRQQLESGNAVVLMQRVQLMTSRMAPLEQELRGARGEQETLQRELDDLEVTWTSFETSVENDRERGQITDEQARGLLEQQREVLALRRKQIDDRFWTGQQRALTLERQLDARRAEIETWESEIDRVLGLR